MGNAAGISVPDAGNAARMLSPNVSTHVPLWHKIRYLTPEAVDKDLARATLGDLFDECQFDQFAQGGVITRAQLIAAIQSQHICFNTNVTKAAEISASSSSAAATTFMDPMATTEDTAEPTTGGKKKVKKKASKKRMTLLCLSNSSGPICKVVADSMAGLRFSKTHADRGKRNCFWFLASSLDLQRALETALPGDDSPLLSKYPGAREACNKAVLSAQLNWVQKLFPYKFDFWPISYNLPGMPKPEP